MTLVTDRGSITTPTPILDKYFIREMGASDIATVAFNELTSRETRWQQEDFRQILGESGVQGRVITLRSQIVGHYIFKPDHDSLHVLNLTLFLTFRRQRIGSTILDCFKRDYLVDQRDSIVCLVRETNSEAHLFLRANGFLAKRVERSYFVDYDLGQEPLREDAYRFVYQRSAHCDTKSRNLWTQSSAV